MIKVEVMGRALCVPTLVGCALLVFGIVASTIDNTQNITGINLLISVLQVVLIQYLCNIGKTSWAWALLIVPAAFAFITTILICAGAIQPPPDWAGKC